MPSIAGPALPLPPTRATAQFALFLDLDGVLAPITTRPGDVISDPRRTAVLEGLQTRLDGRLAIISGRTIAEIDRITALASIAASGVHGLELRRQGGSTERAAASPGVADALSEIRKFATAHPGIIVEDKGVSVGLHYRLVPDAAEQALTLCRDLARRTGLTLQPGSMVLELKTPGTDKGSALVTFMAEAPFARSLPIMVGDDLTDEAGFQAAEALGGHGILVGAPRKTAARYGLPDVSSVLDWLESLAKKDRS